MIVDIDIGNTRAKWRLTAGVKIIERGFIETGSQDWSALLAVRSFKPDRVRVSNVAGQMAEQQLRSVIAETLGIETEFARACSSVGEVRSGYDQPEKLGVDRWLAILAGWHLFRQRCVVVDAGSALTFDFIDAQAGHLGGYIVPGRQMMMDALFDGTSGVRVNSSHVHGADYGQNTDSAVQGGCFATTLALIEKIILQGNEEQGSINMVLTGGDAELLLAQLPKTIVHKPDLVLDGLAVALP